MKSFVAALVAIALFAPVASHAMDRGAIDQALRQLDQAQANIESSRAILYNALRNETVWSCILSTGAQNFRGTGSTEEQARDNAFDQCTNGGQMPQLCKIFRDSKSSTTCHQ